MRVSVILPNRNMGRYLRQSIDSVMAQTLQDFEVLVIDGGSTDESVNIVTSYDQRVRLLKHSGGLPSSINYGVDMAEGDFIARLDADDLCHPSRLEKQVAALEADRESVLCWTDAWRMDKDGRTTGAVWGCNYLSDDQLASGRVFDALLQRNFIPHGSVMIRKSSLGSRRMDESLRYIEDWDLWLRLSLRGKFTHIDELLYGYRTHQAGSQGLHNIRNLILWRAIKGPRHWLSSLPLTPRQRGRLTLTMATMPMLTVGSGVIGNMRPDIAKKRAR